MLWIPFTLLAAFMQTWRNALQKKLKETLSTNSATVSRFILGSPLACIYLALLHSSYPTAIPTWSAHFFIYIAIAGLAQIAATTFMVLLFKERNYAIGVGLGKSEAIIAAIFGAIIFSANLNSLAWTGALLGAIAVWLMSKPSQSLSSKVLALGLASGFCFAICTLLVRQAALQLDSPFIFAAAWSLFWISALQTLIIIVYLSISDRKAFIELWQHARQVFLVSLCGFITSVGWFTAMSLEKVALVKTLGQVEMLFTLALSHFWFKERLSYRDYWGVALIIASAILVVMA